MFDKIFSKEIGKIKKMNFGNSQYLPKNKDTLKDFKNVKYSIIFEPITPKLIANQIPNKLSNIKTNYGLMIGSKIRPSMNSFLKKKNKEDGGFYYLVFEKVKDNGKMVKDKDMLGKIFYHKKNAKKDKLVIGVKYNIVGYKRKTTHLPEGLLINNIEFITE